MDINSPYADFPESASPSDDHPHAIGVYTGSIDASTFRVVGYADTMQLMFDVCPLQRTSERPDWRGQQKSGRTEVDHVLWTTGIDGK